MRPYFPGLLLGAADTAHEPQAHLVEQPHRQRQTGGIRELAPREGEGVEVVADFFHVRVRGSRVVALLCFESQEVDEGGLRSLDTNA